MEKQLYFIGIVPQEEIQKELTAIKYEVADKYNTRAALKSPPHITLYMPFKWKEQKEENLFNVLEKFTAERDSFRLSLNNFGSFAPRVIFVNVEISDALSFLQKDLVRVIKRNLKLIDKGFEERPYHPHITIAFRDLKKPMFWKAWNEEFSNRRFQAEMIVENISLLKHDGKQWQVYRNFKLKN